MRQVQDKNYFINKLLKDREINELLEGQSKKDISGFIENLKEIKQILHIKEQTDKKILEEYNKLIVIPSGSEETLIRELNLFNKAMYDWPEYYILDFGNKATGKAKTKDAKVEFKNPVAQRTAQSENLFSQSQPNNIDNEYNNNLTEEQINKTFNKIIQDAKQNLETNLNKSQEDQQILLKQLAYEFEQEANTNLKSLDEKNNEPDITSKKNNEAVLKQNKKTNTPSFENDDDYFDIDIDDEQYDDNNRSNNFENDNQSEVEFNVDEKWNDNLNNSFETDSGAAYLNRINKSDLPKVQDSQNKKVIRTKETNLPLDFDGSLDELNILLDEKNMPVKNEDQDLYFDTIQKAVENQNQNIHSEQINLEQEPKVKKDFANNEQEQNDTNKKRTKKVEEIKLPKNIFGLSQPYIHESTTNFEATVEDINSLDDNDSNNFEPTIENIKKLDNESVKRLSDEELAMVTEIWEREPIDPLRDEDLSDFEKRLMNAPIKTKDLNKGSWMNEIHDEIMEKDNNILKDAEEIIVDSEEEKNEHLNDIKSNLDEGNYGKLNLSKPMAITCARYMKKLNYLKKGFEKSYGSELFKKVREWIAQENLMYENAERNNRIRKLKTKRFKTQKSILQKQRLKEIFKVKK